MIALRSGLGYSIIDSRNAGNRYDLVVPELSSSESPGSARRHDAPPAAAEVVGWKYAR
jgi:hypothetical protein